MLQAEMDAADLVCGLCTEDGGVNSVGEVGHEEEEWLKYWDDISGRELPRELTRAARAEEIQGIKNMGVYEKVPREMCLAETGKPPIGTRWIDTDKGDSTNPNVRSRLVAQENKRYADPELFSATPPIEYIRFLMSCCASSQWGKLPTRI